MTLISCAVFAYSVNTIGTIFSEIAAKSANFRFFFIFKWTILTYIIKKKKDYKTRNEKIYENERYRLIITKQSVLILKLLPSRKRF